MTKKKFVYIYLILKKKIEKMPLFYKIIYIHNRINTEQVESVIGGYFCGLGQCVGFLRSAVHERIRRTNTYTNTLVVLLWIGVG